MKKYILISSLTLLLAACSSNTETKESESSDTAADTTQFYEYQRAFTKITWTAYKTTAKIGVSGTFKDFSVTGGVSYGTPTAILDFLEFTIPVSSINSENEERDGKIVASFFGSMMNTESITGRITSVTGNDSGGTCRVLINMNEIGHEVDAPYVVNGNKIEIDASIHLGDWKSEPCVSALNAVCNDLHKGEDGVSKLWPEVDIHIESSLKPVANAM
jgi:hypothetical protein